MLGLRLVVQGKGVDNERGPKKPSEKVKKKGTPWRLNVLLLREFGVQQLRALLAERPAPASHSASLIRNC